MTGDLPDWLQRLARAAGAVSADQLSRYVQPEASGRASAVLVLFGDGPDGPDGSTGPDLLLIERATTMRSHPGQPAFPGGATDPGDAGPAGTALREAAEEVGLEPTTVRIVAELPGLWLPPSGFVVTPVLAWWRSPHPVSAVNPAEVARVVRVPLAQLAEPVNRMSVRHPSGRLGPAFAVRGMLVWGFTAGLIDKLLSLGGWERPWNADRIAHLPTEAIERAARTTPVEEPRDATA